MAKRHSIISIKLPLRLLKASSEVHYAQCPPWRACCHRDCHYYGVVGSSLTQARVEPWERLSARLAATAKIVDASTGKIKNSQLRSINSDTKLYITNTQRDLAKPLAALSINSEKLPKSILASESGQAMATRLENGRLNAKYDSTYAREMTYQLATLLALLQQLYGTNVTEATKDSLKSWYDNLLPIYKSVSEFSASNE